MKIMVNRFTLRHNGVDYGRGEVVEIDDETGAALIARSRGSLIEIAEPKVALHQEAEENKAPTVPPKQPPSSLPDDKGEGEEAEEESDAPPITLPDANPAQAVQPARKGGRKK